MALGGARPGAGRKKGSATAKTREIADRAAAEGVTPLEFMLQVMRDVTAERSERLDMAKSAAPYIHPRLSAVEAKVAVTEQVEEVRWSIVDPEPVDP
jgi:hypothetical protein